MSRINKKVCGHLGVDDEADPGDGDKKNAGNVHLQANNGCPLKKANMLVFNERAKMDYHDDSPGTQVVHAFLLKAPQNHTPHILLERILFHFLFL